MNLDLGTLAIALGFSMLIRVVAIGAQFAINREYRGIGLWVAASVAAAVGFALLFIRGMDQIPPVVIVLQNTFLVLAILLEYLGIMAFLGRRPHHRVALSGFVVFVAALTFFSVIRDDIAVRTVLVHAALAMVALWSAANIWADKRVSIRQSTRFMSVIYVIGGGYYATHAIFVLAGGAADSIIAPSLLQTAELLVVLAQANLLTFGFIIMIGQRLHADVNEVRQRFELLFNASPDISIITRLSNGVVVSVNDGFTANTGYTRDEIVGHSTVESLWDDPTARTAVVEQLTATGACDSYEAVFVRKDGVRFVGIVSSRMLELDNEAHAISVIRDITDRKELENELKVRATTDALTGVANRGHFIELAQSELRRAQRHHHPVSILLLDIDRFKKINDTCGHLVGDSVLVTFTEVAQGVIRSIDVLARFGGDEFVMLLPETGEIGAQEVAERIRSAFEEVGAGPCGCEVAVTACLGVAAIRADDEPLDSLLGRADFALYRAKELGRNRVEVSHIDA